MPVIAATASRGPRAGRRVPSRRRLAPVVVFDGPLALLLLGERDIEVEVEVSAERGRPGKRPPHPLLVCPQLRERRPRDRPEHDVVVGQMDDKAVEPVRDRRTGRTPRRVVGPEHEVIDEQLRAPAEEVRQRGAPLIGLESILPCRSAPTATPAAAAPARRCAALVPSPSLSSSSRAASHSSRVPVICFVIVLLSLWYDRCILAAS